MELKALKSGGRRKNNQHPELSILTPEFPGLS
jgi:hypothetical protein